MSETPRKALSEEVVFSNGFTLYGYPGLLSTLKDLRKKQNHLLSQFQVSMNPFAISIRCDIDADLSFLGPTDFPAVKKPPFAMNESFANSPRRSHLAQVGDDVLTSPGKFAKTYVSRAGD